jgi:hypothetical protein
LTKLRNNEIKTSGEYFVCAELARIGLIATLTSGNAAIVDILATRDGSKSASIQVKASQGTGNSHAWDIGTKKPNPSDSFFFVFVNIWQDEKIPPEYYIVPSSTVRTKVNWHKDRPLFILSSGEIDSCKNNWEPIKEYFGIK